MGNYAEKVLVGGELVKERAHAEEFDKDANKGD
jgi:hypothetical protein